MNKELMSSFRNLETNTELRTMITTTGDLFFCLVDICDNLNLTNPSVTKKAPENEYGDGLFLLYPIVDSLGRTQEATFIPESHIYFLIFRSNKEEARKFRKWVTEEVIPSLRKTGSYVINSSYPASPYTPELLAKIKRLEKELKVARSTARLFTFSNLAEDYGLSESTLKLLIGELGVNLDELAYKRGKDMYLDSEGVDIVWEAVNKLSRNFNKRIYHHEKEDADIAFKELIGITNESELPF